MAQIKKMMVQGIRSFNPAEDAAQVIEFYCPMTLIVGQNGCGKTTIIEALKYSITGKFPPNTKNGAFINDPKLSSGYEVKAHVKLELKDRKLNKVVVARKLKATTTGKIGNVTVSTLEGTIAHYMIQPNGSSKKVEMNSKCCDIQESINSVVGVPEPILDNVIFCHQEDACWPLDAASQVKVKFDAIFNTTMYIKALKSLHDQEKGVAVDIKLATKDFDYTRQDLEDAKKKMAKLEEHTIEMSSMNDKIAEHDKKLQAFRQNIQRLERLQNNFFEKQKIVSEKQGQITELEKMIQQFRGNIREPFEGDIAALIKRIEQFEFIFRQKSDVHKKLTREKRVKEDERKRLTAKNETFVISKGIFESESTLNVKKLEEMANLMENLFKYIRAMKENSQEDGSSFAISLDSVLMSFEHDADTVEPSTAIKALTSAISSKESEHTKLKAKLDAEELKLRNELEQLNNSEATIMTQVKMKQDSEKGNKLKGDNLWRRLNELESSSDTLLLLNDQEQQITENIERLEKSELIKNFETELTTLQADIIALEEKRSVLQTQTRLLTTDATFVDRIKTANAFKLKKRGECNEILRRIEPQLKNLLEGDEIIPEENLNSFLQKKLNTLTKEVVEKTREQTRIGKEIVKIDTQKKQITRELEKKQKELAVINRKADTVLGGASFEDEYANIFKDTEEAQSDLSQNEAASFLYKTYVQKLSKKSCCPLCKRDFAKEEESKALLESLTKTMKKMEISKPAQEAKLAELKEKQEQLVKLKPNWDTMERLEKVEFPELRQKKEEYETQLRSYQDTASELSETLSLLTLEKASAESLQKDTALYDKSQADKNGVDADIKKFDASRDPTAKELTVTLVEVQTEMQSIDSTISARRKEKERKEQLKNKKIVELTKAKEERNKVIGDKLKITADLQNKEAMEQQKKDLEAEAKTLRASISELNKQLPSVRMSVTQTNSKITDLKKSKDEELDAIVKEKNGLVTQKDRVNQLHKEIEAFRLKQVKYDQEAGKRKECTEALETCDATISEMTQELGIIANEINSQEAKKSELEYNRLFKEKELERDKLKADIEDDRKAIETAKIRGISAELEDEVQKREDEDRKKNKILFSMSASREAIRSLKEDLAYPKYANAEVNHRKTLIKKTVYERAKMDIRLYRTALDSAVMTFHRKKMETINKYLKLYWKKVYKGNDIDYIEIKTENDDNAAEKKKVKIDMNKTTRRNYNYRVVMFRRGIELDMRGRCSAGQKVLASIIIRLSLAQTFASHCGIITLDEPTTNLDKQNIDSLAETLSDLALSMRGHSTFQLVVITHDQDFIDTLLRVDPIDYYYKVSRDRLGFSLIERIEK